MSLIVILPSKEDENYIEPRRVGKNWDLVKILKIIEDEEGTGGYFLLNLDENLNLIDDTWHPTLEEAIEQAEWEFHVAKDQW